MTAMEVLLPTLFASIIGFILISQIRRPPAYLPMRGVGHPELDEAHAQQLGDLSLPEFEAMMRRFVNDYIGLRIDVVARTADAEIEIRATDDKPMVGGTYIIHGVL